MSDLVAGRRATRETVKNRVEYRGAGDRERAAAVRRSDSRITAI
jgi:hypothetical protein